MREILVTSVLNKQRRRDDWFLTDYSINPCSGCTIDCSYCYVYGSKYGAHLDEMIRRAKESGAQFVFVGGLTLFGDQETDSRTRYYRFLSTHFPNLVGEYDRLYRNSTGPPRYYQNRLETKARKLCQHYGLRYGIS